MYEVKLFEFQKITSFKNTLININKLNIIKPLKKSLLHCKVRELIFIIKQILNFNLSILVAN